MEKKSFSIIRHRGQPNKLQLPDGTWVYKKERIFVPEYGRFVPVIQYSDHFIYEIPQKLAEKYPGSVYRCSCGAPAVLSGATGYSFGGSPEGYMFLCLHHSTYGIHISGGARWI